MTASWSFAQDSRRREETRRAEHRLRPAGHAPSPRWIETWVRGSESYVCEEVGRELEVGILWYWPGLRPAGDQRTIDCGYGKWRGRGRQGW